MANMEERVTKIEAKTESLETVMNLSFRHQDEIVKRMEDSVTTLTEHVGRHYASISRLQLEDSQMKGELTAIKEKMSLKFENIEDDTDKKRDFNIWIAGAVISLCTGITLLILQAALEMFTKG